MNGARWILLTLAVMISALLSPAPAAAHQGHHHTSVGKVKSAAVTQLDLEAMDGKVETFALTDTTIYRRGDRATTRENLEVGERAVVTYETESGRNPAIEVKVGAKKAEAQHSTRPAGTPDDGRR